VTTLRRVPPGRAGRVWLLRRIAAAERGRALLEKKLRILRIEQQRLQLLAGTTSADWEQSCCEAESWLLRAGLVAGERGLLESARPATATAEVLWRSVMGVRFPREAKCRVAEWPPSSAASGTVALLFAETAFEHALRAAVTQAAVESAVRTIDAEVALTRVRLRGLDDRWIPRLRTALAELERSLEQLEHEEGVRRRWAADRGAGLGRAQ
jgi:V/A-type H+-transporting ATPase subunit D